MSLSQESVPYRNLAVPRVYIVTESFGSSDDDPFASREEDKALKSESIDAFDFDVMQDIYQRIVDIQELGEDEGNADWSLQEARKKLAERHMANDGINSHAPNAEKISHKCIDYSNAPQPR